jgi:hypothetical protein
LLSQLPTPRIRKLKKREGKRESDDCETGRNGEREREKKRRTKRVREKESAYRTEGRGHGQS